MEYSPERLALFKSSIDKMIATSENSYNVNKYSSGYSFRNSLKSSRNYTKEEVTSIISSGDLSAMRELSRAYFDTSGFYKRILSYYANLLTYSYIMIPHFKRKVNNNSKNAYYQALETCESFNVKEFCNRAAIKVLVDGVYFGAVVEQGDKISIMDLPYDYCRSRFKGFSGLHVVEFDLRYFTTITDKTMRDYALSIYPKGMKKAYNKYILGKGDQWFMIPEGTGIYLKLNEARPYFLSTILAVETFEDYRELEIKKETLQTKKILVQKIKTNTDGSFSIEPEEAEEMHRGSVRMLKNNEDLDVLTTYADVDLLGIADQRQTVNSNLTAFQNMIYAESGASAGVFSATGNLALEHSINNDLSLMMTLAAQFSTVLTYILNTKKGSNTVSYEISILPITHFNTKQYIDNAYKLATAGYSFIVPSLALGISQRQLIDIKELENNILNMEDMLKPLQSSFTSSGEKKEAVNPGKANEEKSDKTITNIEGSE